MRRILTLILLLYLVLGAAYSVANPIFEGPDESLNYANVRYLVEERHLPVLEPDEPTKAHHPPLYYVLGAVLTHWVPNEYFDDIVNRENAFWAFDVGRYGVDNKSIYLHMPTLEGWPYRDVALGVHLIRWFSLLLGAGTVLLVYATARLIFPQRALPLVAAALVALNPMFLYIQGTVHDDALTNLLAAATLYGAAVIMVRGLSLRRAVILGGVVGLAALTKLTALLVVPTVGLALVWRSFVEEERRGWRKLLRLGGATALTALLVSGWWFVRNQRLYGEPTSMVRQVEAWGGTREGAPNLAAAFRELGFLLDSFWGAFGYGQVPMPSWVYGTMRLVSVIALTGLVIYWARRQSGRARWERPRMMMLLLLLLSAPVICFGVVFARMTMIDTADFGRYLFVSLAYLAPLYALGLTEVSSGRSVLFGVLFTMTALAVFGLAGVLYPAYAAPPMLSEQQVRARTRPVDLRFGDGIRLLGYDLSDDRVAPSGAVEATLCWQTLEPMEEDYVYFVHILGAEERIFGRRNTHPGLSRYPTSRWMPGDLFCDRLRVPVSDGVPAPAVYDVEIGWREPDAGDRLPIHDSSGRRLEFLSLDKVKTVPPVDRAIEVPKPVGASLDSKVTLRGYALDRTSVSQGETLDVTLYWAAQRPLDVDYTVFLHLASSEGSPHAQDDGQPRRGTYPTSFWDVGEIVIDPRQIRVPDDLPPGDYQVVAGLYILETGERLRWTKPGGTVRGDAVPLTTVSVELAP